MDIQTEHKQVYLQILILEFTASNVRFPKANHNLLFVNPSCLWLLFRDNFLCKTVTNSVTWVHPAEYIISFSQHASSWMYIKKSGECCFMNGVCVTVRITSHSESGLQYIIMCHRTISHHQSLNSACICTVSPFSPLCHVAPWKMPQTFRCPSLTVNLWGWQIYCRAGLFPLFWLTFLFSQIFIVSLIISVFLWLALFGKLVDLFGHCVVEPLTTKSEEQLSGLDRRV